MKARNAACAAALVLVGCATLRLPDEAVEWPSRRAALQALDDWTLAGRVALAAGSDGFSGGLRWRQDGEVADIEVRNPLGATALSIRLAGSRVTITDAEGRTQENAGGGFGIAGYPDAAILPIEQLRYWLLGVPAPGTAYEELPSGQGRLEGLMQDGWELRYPRYRAAGTRMLPARIDLARNDVRVRVVVSEWHTPP
ncbi:MAG: lipoprotein insertase outer membrane protein LolB [Gammaproteobacteria bacterium]